MDENSDDLSWLDELLDCEDSNEEAESELAESQERLVAELLAQGSTEKDAKEWVKEFCDYTANELDRLTEDNEELLALLDGPFRTLRDNTQPDPERLLVWDREATPSVQALTFEEATERYKCGGVGSRWAPEDLKAVKEAKRECLEETLSSYAKQETDLNYEGLCSTPALVVSNNPLKAHRWAVVKACLRPETGKTQGAN
jgi:hypothetical protein